MHRLSPKNISNLQSRWLPFAEIRKSWISFGSMLSALHLNLVFNLISMGHNSTKRCLVERSIFNVRSPFADVLNPAHRDGCQILDEGLLDRSSRRRYGAITASSNLHRVATMHARLGSTQLTSWCPIRSTSSEHDERGPQKVPLLPSNVMIRPEFYRYSKPSQNPR